MKIKTPFTTTVSCLGITLLGCGGLQDTPYGAEGGKGDGVQGGTYFAVVSYERPVRCGEDYTPRAGAGCYAGDLCFDMRSGVCLRAPSVLPGDTYLAFDCRLPPFDETAIDLSQTQPPALPLCGGTAGRYSCCAPGDRCAQGQWDARQCQRM